MSIIGHAEAFTPESIEKTIPTVFDAPLCAEYAHGKNRILLMLNYGDGLLEHGAFPIENFEILMLANDVLASAPHIGIDIARPALDMTAVGVVGMFRHSTLPLGKALRSEDRFAEAKSLQYTVQVKENRSVYPRDSIMIPSVGDSSETTDLLLGLPPTFTSKSGQHTDYTPHVFALSMGLQLGMKAKQLPIRIIGGNVIVSRDFVFTLQDTFHKNGIFPREGDLIVNHIPSPKGNVTLGKDIAILDAPLVNEGKQRVFHLDVLVNVVLGADGEEYILLANPFLARDILEKHGFLGNGKFNVGRWRSLAGYKSYTNNAVSDTARLLADGAIRSAGRGVRPNELTALATQLEQSIGFPRTAHTDIGMNIAQFFRQENLGPLGEYIRTIRESLLSLGIRADHILDIPTLLFWDGFQEVNMNFDRQRIHSSRNIPMYMPVNGVQMRGSNDDASSIYFAAGGIKVLDDEISGTLGAIGIRHIGIPSAIGLGYGSAGFHCLAVPWR